MNYRIFVVLIAIFFTFSSCNRAFEKTLKSTDPEEIVANAKSFYEKGKYDYASRAFEHSKKFIYGTEYAKEVDYYIPMTSLALKNYPLAAQEFTAFANRYRKDSLAEEAQYMGAYCYYKGSLPYNLDPKNTHSAIAELQKFINQYPNSEKVSECNQLINELHQRLEEKAFANARTLYKIARYRSSSVAFDNMIDDFPDSKYKEEALWYSFQSKAEYAFNSYNYLKNDRFTEALTTYKLLKKDYPNSQYIDDADKIIQKIDKEKQELQDVENVNLQSKTLANNK